MIAIVLSFVILNQLLYKILKYITIKKWSQFATS